MNTITIRVAQKEDMAAVLRLIKELAAFEKEPHEVEVSVEELQHDGFGPDPAFHRVRRIPAFHLPQKSNPKPPGHPVDFHQRSISD